jgi:hypothetical protein
MNLLEHNSKKYNTLIKRIYGHTNGKIIYQKTPKVAA